MWGREGRGRDMRERGRGRRKRGRRKREGEGHEGKRNGHEEGRGYTSVNLGETGGGKESEDGGAVERPFSLMTNFIGRGIHVHYRYD